MFNILKNKLKEKIINYKAKHNWNKWKHYSYKEMFPDRHRNQIKAANELYIPLLPANAQILDLGCGDGWFDLEIASKVGYIDAIDLSKRFIQIAISNQKLNNINNINFIVGEVDKEIPIHKLYDSVMCMGLFTCISKESVVNKIIQDFNIRLKPGGILFLKDSLNRNKTEYYENGSYAAIYRSDQEYKDLFIRHNYQLLYEGDLSDNTSETGGFSGFKIFRKLDG